MPIISDHFHEVDDEDVTVIPSVDAVIGRVADLEQALHTPGTMLFVDQHGTGTSGSSWGESLATMQEALDILTAMDDANGGSADDSVIFVRGDMHGSVTTPGGVRGVRIIGAAGSPGSNGATWSTATGNTPLLTVLDQGWVVEDLMFVPKAGYSAIKLDSVDGRSAGYANVRRCHFIGPGAYGTETGIGVQVIDGGFVRIEDCDFEMLDTALIQTPTGASALRWKIRRNKFEGNKTDILMSANRCLIAGNVFFDPYHVTTHPVTIDLTHDADVGSNRVLDNTFGDLAANITNAKGYTAATGDVWRYRAAATAADIVTVPA